MPGVIPDTPAVIMDTPAVIMDTAEVIMDTAEVIPDTPAVISFIAEALKMLMPKDQITYPWASRFLNNT